MTDRVDGIYLEKEEEGGEEGEEEMGCIEAQSWFPFIDL